MKRRVLVLAAVIILAGLGSLWAQEAMLLTLAQDIAQEKVFPLAQKDIVIDIVKQANKEEEKSLANLIELEKKWRELDESDPWINGFLTNITAKFLRKIQQNDLIAGVKLYAEIFVMDKQGFIVAETDKTTDYWQGDEAKFTKAFASGQGDTFISAPSFDESAQSYLIHVCVPVRDEPGGEAIGVLAAGLRLKALGERRKLLDFGNWGEGLSY